MIRGGLAAGAALFAGCFSVAAQQANTLSPALPLTLYQPKTLIQRSSLLLRQGPVRAWSDGGQLASETAFVSIGMTPLNLLPPLAYFVPTANGAAPSRTANGAARSAAENLGTDGKDLSGEVMNSPLNNMYYGGEVGFLYGHSIGKGGGDLIDSYITGTAGNDHFQITAGAEYEDWSGHTSRFHSFVPR